MLPGRPNEGTQIKKLQGTYRKDRHGDGPVAFTPVVKVSVPRHLSKSARKEWKVITQELIKANMLQSVDLTVLAAYCQEIADYWELRQFITENGRTFISPNGHLCQRPQVSMMGKSLERAMKIGLRFGITPVAREKIRIRTPNGGKPDPTDGLV